MARRLSKLIVIGLAALMVAGCEASIPKEALQLTPDSLARRQVQTRVFETTNEAELLAASAHLLQDLGFNLDESEVDGPTPSTTLRLSRIRSRISSSSRLSRNPCS